MATDYKLKREEAERTSESEIALCLMYRMIIN